MGMTFLTVPLPMYEPMEARESTATSTPDAKVKASVVVPWEYLRPDSVGWEWLEVRRLEGRMDYRLSEEHRFEADRLALRIRLLRIGDGQRAMVLWFAVTKITSESTDGISALASECDSGKLPKEN